METRIWCVFKEASNPVWQKGAAYSESHVVDCVLSVFDVEC